MNEHRSYVAPLVENILNAAHDLTAAGLEMDSRVNADAHAALMRLVHAVYTHEDALELQRELEVDGVREASVFEASVDGLPSGSYSAHVDRIIAAAGSVAESMAASTAGAVPQYALNPMCSLVQAVTAYYSHPNAARQWQEAGNRLALLITEGPDEPLPPPSTTPPSRPHRIDVANQLVPAARPTGGGETAALAPGRPQLDAATPRSGAETASVAASHGARLRCH